MLPKDATHHISSPFRCNIHYNMLCILIMIIKPRILNMINKTNITNMLNMIWLTNKSVYSTHPICPKNTLKKSSIKNILTLLDILKMLTLLALFIRRKKAQYFQVAQIHNFFTMVNTLCMLNTLCMFKIINILSMLS